jgi:hypothetical protein
MILKIIELWSTGFQYIFLSTAVTDQGKHMLIVWLGYL